MLLQSVLRCGGVLMLALYTSAAFAQGTPPYGAPISLENAKKTAAAALAEARRAQRTPVVAIVDIAGDLVYFEKVDGAQTGSVDIAIAKARSAARYKRSTEWFYDQLAAGGSGLRILRSEGAMPMRGGIPLVIDGRIVGAIGVSGGPDRQLGEWAQAGADALQ